MDGGYSGRLQWLPTGEGGKFLCLVLPSPSYPILQALGHTAAAAAADTNFNFLITIPNMRYVIIIMYFYQIKI